MSPQDWDEQTSDVISERVAARAADLEPLAVATILVFKTNDGDVVTRVIARGDFDALNASFQQIGEVANAATKQRTWN